MTSLLTFIFILGILILIHEFGHFLAAKRQGIKVEKFYLGFGPMIARRKHGDTEYGINLIPLGGYVKLAGDSMEDYKGISGEYLSKTPLERARVIFAGPLFNYLLGFFCFWLIFCTGYPTLTTKVGGLIEGFGAAEAGIQAGDRITAVDGLKVSFWEDLQDAIRARKSRDTVKISLLRQEKEYTFEVKLREKQFDDSLGEKRKVALLGVTPDLEEIVRVRNGPIKAFALSIEKVFDLTAMNYKALWAIVTRKISMRESATGPLGIFYIASKAASLGITAVLHLIAVLSVSLAIFNLLPLPVLDGGHLVLLAVEKLRGKALGLNAERIISQVGVAVIVTLALIVTYNDIIRFFGEKIPRVFH